MSMDGLLCSWNIENMSKPQEIIELKPTKGDDFSVTTFSIPDNDTSSLYVGTEEGTVYQANLVDKGGVKQGINRNGNFKGHFAPITGIHVHPSYGSIDFSNYFLTSSLDWTVKLWKHDVFFLFFFFLFSFFFSFFFLSLIVKFQFYRDQNQILLE